MARADCYASRWDANAVVAYCYVESDGDPEDTLTPADLGLESILVAQVVVGTERRELVLRDGDIVLGGLHEAHITVRGQPLRNIPQVVEMHPSHTDPVPVTGHNPAVDPELAPAVVVRFAPSGIVGR